MKLCFLLLSSLLIIFFQSSCSDTEEIAKRQKALQEAHEEQAIRLDDKIKEEEARKVREEKRRKELTGKTGDPLQDDAIDVKPYKNDKPVDEKLKTDQKAPLEVKKEKSAFYEKLAKEGDKPVEVAISFDAATINDIVPAFAQMLKFNYLIDPQVKGAVTMTVNSKMTEKEAWQMFEQILWLSGAYCSPDGDVIHILPFAKMPQERKMLAGHDPSANVEVDLLPIRSASSKDLIEKIKPFMTEGATVVDIPHQNSILIVETPANLTKLKELVKMLDRKNKADWPQTVIRCNNISATRVKNELASLLPVLGFPVTADNVVAEPGSIHLMSLDRLQALIATAANQEALDELNHWVEILDRSDVGEQEKIFIYKVVNAKADELAQALSTMFAVDGSSVSSSSYPSSSSTGSSTSTAPDTSSKSSTKTSSSLNSSSLKNSNSGKNSDGPGSLFEIPVKVFVDSVQNRLVVRTVPRTYAMVNAVLARLDTVASQVLLQVTVSEITLTESTQFGLEFSDEQTANGVKSLYGTNYSSLNPGSSTDYGAKYWLTNTNNPDEKFAYLKALAGNGKINVLSSPQLVVVSHTEASINVGDKVPIVTSEITDTASTSSNNTAVRRSIQYENTGIILTITPHVTKGGLITMDIKQEVSDAVKNTLSDLDSPVIQQRVVKTSLSIRDGSTLFVGGLIRERESDTLSTLPFLTSVPLLAKMFGSNEYEKKKTELVVMVTGRIIDENSRVEEMTRRYKQAAEAIRRLENGETGKKKDKSL